MDSKKWEDAAQSFEASLMIRRSGKNSEWTIGFTVHPDDVPEETLRVRMGARFRVVLFPIGDDEEPTPTPVPMPEPKVSMPKGEGQKAVGKAGELCRRESFQRWILQLSASDPIDDSEGGPQGWMELDSIEALRDWCGIESRSELATSDRALDTFNRMVKEYSDACFEELKIQ